MSAVHGQGVFAHPDTGIAMMLRVDREDAGRADDDVVDICAAALHD
nr:hypothetical protein [Actinospica durhamensis]